jgi:drug/metabolite transporter (DMT)-like permease
MASCNAVTSQPVRPRAGVSSVLADAPLYTAQALRYAIACALLVGWARMTGRRLHRPRGAEWLWLIGVAVTGLVVFNVALVNGSRHAEPAVLAVAVACVPVALAAIGPMLEGRSPRARVLAAAIVVSTGAMVVEGLGRSDAVGILWALTVFVCEAGFTLLAVPVLGRHGPEGVSVHTTWLAVAMFTVLAICTEGCWAVRAFDIGDMLAIGYLAVGVTAVWTGIALIAVGLAVGPRATLKRRRATPIRSADVPVSTV